MEGHLDGRVLVGKAHDDFKEQLEKLTVTAVDGRCYVLVDALRKWMRARPRADHGDQFATNTELLLHAAYPDGYYPIDHWRVAAAGEDCCVIVFSILLELKLGHLIHWFAMKTFVDRRLPEDLFSLKNKLRDLEDVDGEKVADEFNKTQWKFCPALFMKDRDYDYVEERIIPICRKSELSSGGIARVSQIVVQSEFVDEELKKLMVHDDYAFYDDIDYGPCYIFALKTFEEGRFDACRDEKKAFDGLRGNPGVIRCLGSYSHRTRLPFEADGRQLSERPEPTQAKTTKNLLLEFGTYDLKQIFEARLPPVLPKEVVAFWQALFEVADALHGIHEFKSGGSGFNGWHVDIKPENIIYVGNKYKLADPGFARFQSKDRDGVPRMKVHGGADTYGAPEISRLAPVYQTIDTWSLGCVFSMTATWVILGDQGVRQYQKVREKALAALFKSTEQNDGPLLISQRLDCFHDGTDVLSEVTSWHGYLSYSARKSDPITAQVLDLVDRKMLLRYPTQRIKSGSLCGELKQIVGVSKRAIQESEAAESMEDRKHRRRVEGLLREIDDEAESKFVQETPPESRRLSPPGLPVDRNALQLHLDQVALRKTSHRFEIEAEPVSTTSNTSLTGRVLDWIGVRVNPIMIPSAPNIMSSSESSQTQSLSESTSPTDYQSLAQSPRFGPQSGVGAYQTAGERFPDHAKQNVLQAHESMDRESRRKGSLGGMMPKRRPRKDEFLSTHFRNRDIKFLVDDAHTMSEHWDEATFLLETLVKKAYGQEPDGPDLSFTNHPAELRSGREVAPFRRIMEMVSPGKSRYARHTDMRRALKTIFHEYLSMVQSKSDKSKVNALTVIILTDGLWQGLNNRDLIFETIVDFYKQLEKEMRHWKIKDRRQVSLQFIQFGDEEEAGERLRRLDDDLPFYGIDDIVDHERFSVSGNIYKMLLGSFVEQMDGIVDSVHGFGIEGVPLQIDDTKRSISTIHKSSIDKVFKEGMARDFPDIPGEHKRNLNSSQRTTRVGTIINKVSDGLSSTIHKSLTDKDFKNIVAQDFPYIPGEHKRNLKLPQIEELYNSIRDKKGEIAPELRPQSSLARSAINIVGDMPPKPSHLFTADPSVEKKLPKGPMNTRAMTADSLEPLYYCNFPDCHRSFVTQDLCARHHESHISEDSPLSREYTAMQNVGPNTNAAISEFDFKESSLPAPSPHIFASTGSSCMPETSALPVPIGLTKSSIFSCSESSKDPENSASLGGVPNQIALEEPSLQTSIPACLPNFDSLDSIDLLVHGGGHSSSDGEQSPLMTKHRSPPTEATSVTSSNETGSLGENSLDADIELDCSLDDRLLNPTGYLDRIKQLRQRVFQNSAIKNPKTPRNLSSDISGHEILLDELQQLINNVCKSLRSLQDEGFCGKFFSFLVQDRFRPTVAKLLPIEIARVERLRVRFMETFLPLEAMTEKHYPASDSTGKGVEELVSACCDLLVQLQITPNISKSQNWAHLCATTVHLLDLAVLSYVGTHTGNLDDTYLDHSGSSLHIPGRFGALCRNEFEQLSAKHTISVKKRKLQCLDQFLKQSSVWVFQDPSIYSTDKPLYLSTDVETLADIWGPLWKIKPEASPDNVLRYDLGNGFIVPWDRNPESDDPNPCSNGEGEMEVFCHWISTRDWNDAYVEQHQMKVLSKCFLETDRLLIGASVKDRLAVNGRCDMSVDRKVKIKQGLKSNDNLRYRGTRRFRLEKGSQTFQVQASAMGFATLGTNIEYKRIEGFNRKDVLMQQWRNRFRNIKYLEIWGGVEVSLCTTNARRVQLLHLLRSRGLRNYLKTISFKWIDGDCETAYFEALKDRRSFQKFWMDHPKWQQNVGDAINECFIALEETGVDERDNELSALWVDGFEDDNEHEENGCGPAFVPAEELLVILRRSEHNWTGLLKDSPECLTMAVAEDICLDFDDNLRYGMRCQGLRFSENGMALQRFSPGYPVLQTAILINETLLEGRSQRQLWYQKIAKDVNESDRLKRKGKVKSGEPHPSDHAACLLEYFGEVPRIWKECWNTTNLRQGTKFSLGSHGHLEVVQKLTDGYSVFMEWQPVLNKLGKDVKVELKEVALGRSGDCHHWEYMGGACLEAPVPCLILSCNKPSKREEINCS